MKQYIAGRDNEHFGCMGEYAEYEDYHVGDLIYYVDPYSKGANFIVKSPNKEGYSIFGWCGKSLKELYNLRFKRILPYNLVTKEIIEFINPDLTLKDVKIDMTKEEIENKLGYRINII